MAAASVQPSKGQVQPLTLALELDDHLAERLDLDSLQQELALAAGAMLYELGIPDSPRVHVTVREGLCATTQRILVVAIADHPCLYPEELLCRAYQYVSGTYPDGPVTPARAQELLPQQRSTFIRLAWDEILKVRPALLLTAAGVSAYRTALVAQTASADLPRSEWLQPVLRAVLDLRISLANHTTVAQVLQKTEPQGQVATAEALIAALRPQVLEVQLSLDYLRQLTLPATGDDFEVFTSMRYGLFYELGIQYPQSRFVPVEDGEPGTFRFQINHLTTLPWRGLGSDECLVNDTPERLRLLDIQGRTSANPANGNRCGVIPVADGPLALEAGLTVWNPIGYLVLALSAELRQHAACFFDLNVTESSLDKLAQGFPKLVTDARAKVPPERIAHVLRRLLSEELSIRNLRQILQALVDFDYIVIDDTQYILFDTRLPARSDPDPGWLQDPVILAAYVRTTMKRYIGHKYSRGSNTLQVYLIAPEIETLLANHEAVAAELHQAQIGPDNRALILTAVRAELGSMADLPMTSSVPVILTATSVRTALRELLAPEFPHLPVLSYQELPPDINLQPIARIAPPVSNR